MAYMECLGKVNQITITCFEINPRHDLAGTAIGLPISWGGARGVNVGIYGSPMECPGFLCSATTTKTVFERSGTYGSTYEG